MGTCCSKRTINCSSPSPNSNPQNEIKPNPQSKNKKPEEETVKKETFVIKHRKSHEIDRRSDEETGKKDQRVISAATTSCTTTSNISSEAAEFGTNTSSSSYLMSNGLPNGGVVVRTSSCTKEEVDALLIQCGRLSRSSSVEKTAVSGQKYSGSKRSYDFDHDGKNDDYEDNVVNGGDEEGVRHRQSRRQSRPSPNRRRTPSRERDHQQQQQQNQRSGSTERIGSSGGGGGRRVSRSPGRRSESPITGSNMSKSIDNGSNRPGKLVSVPATVSSLVMDKSNNGGGGEARMATIKRVSVKRNAASPRRSRSPARANVRVSNENQNQNQNGNPNQNQQQQGLPSLSRSNSRKAEQSPYRRNPLAEIDQNFMAANNTLPQKQSLETITNGKTSMQDTVNKSSIVKGVTKEQHPMEDHGKGLQQITGNVAVNVVPSGPETLKPQALTRTRSSRLSRDLDLNIETQNPSSSSYTALLLEDIQNFHNKSSPPISLPPCLSKACSILEAVADLNSSNGGSLSVEGNNFVVKKRYSENKEKDPILESEVIVNNDLMEPSFHKYVTVKRGNVGNGDMLEEKEESSGSNSFVGGQQHWVSSSLWETNSTDSTDCWASSTSNTRKDDRKKRELDHQKMGIGRGRVDTTGRGLHSRPTITTATI